MSPVAVLIGPPGAGKSTVGPLLAALLGAEFAETDALVEEAAGKPVSDIFIADGEPAFRDLERTAVAEALRQHPGIVSLGGGAVVPRLLRHRAGGIEGGMSTGEVIRLRVAMKPISTVPRALDTIDTSTGEPAKAINQRSDATAVPAAGVVAEAMAALVLAEAAVEKFGGDSADEMRRNAESYLKALVIS